MNYQIKIEPRDKLFFKDGRPLGASSVGGGANWPLPTLFHSAMLSAIHQNGYNDNWESTHENISEKEEKKKNTRYKLGGLKTFGPFPIINDDFYFPTPADIESSGAIMQPIDLNNSSNLPQPLKYCIANNGAPTKEELGEWISTSELIKYLNGSKSDTVKSAELFTSESTPGVAINPETRANEESKFYQADYLRLREDNNVSMVAFADCEARKFNGETVDVLGDFFKDKNKNFIFGGQRGVAYMDAKRETYLPGFKKPEGVRIKWLLLSPALFNNGWLPDWIDKYTGKVMLKERPEKGNLSRKEWREQIKNAPNIGASLVAARIPKPTVMSGWKLDINKDNAGGQPKATRVAVSAGAVYYFECENKIEAGKLIEELHCKVKSTQFGEQGFGLGICSAWELNSLCEIK